MNRIGNFSSFSPIDTHPVDREEPSQIAGTRRGRESDSSGNNSEPPQQRQRTVSPSNHRPAIARQLLHSWNRFNPRARHDAGRDSERTTQRFSRSVAEAGPSRREETPPQRQSQAHPDNRHPALVRQLMQSWNRFTPDVRHRAVQDAGNEETPQERQHRASPTAITGRLMQSWRRFNPHAARSSAQVPVNTPAAPAGPSVNANATLLRNSAPPHASQSLLRWAEESRRRIMEMENSPVLLARDRHGSFANEPALRQVCFDIAYRLYAHPTTSAQRLNRLEQEQFLRDLEALAEGGSCAVLAQPMEGLPRGLSPLAALEHNPDLAIATHYYVRPDDMEIRHASNTDVSEARMSLTLTPSHVVEVANNMVPLLTEFADFITHFKVTSPRGQGTRPDSIVIYLNQARISRARELAARLRGMATPETWATGSPLGMQALHAGIAYAEFNRNSVSHSFGEDRARMVVDALINSMSRGTHLQTEVEKAILGRRYSLDNPALIART